MADLAFALHSDAKDLDATRWDRLVSDANRWRGEILDVFAHAEFAVGETLHAAGCKGQGLYLVGPKFDALAKLVGNGGSLAEAGASVRGELARFRHYDDLRSTLCHGAMSVTMDVDGDWVAIFRLTVFRTSGTEREVAVFSRLEAEDLREALKRRQDTLCGQLRAMRGKIAG